MKKYTRRDFLKVAGVSIAAASLGALGEGCQPIQPPVAVPTPIPPPGPDYKIPSCCSYNSTYRVNREPKRPAYGEMARPLGAAFDYSNNPDNLPNGAHPEDLSRDTKFVLDAVRNCLAFSIDMLFVGDTHSARNGLASVAELITFYFGGYMSIYLPENAPPLSKNFFDSSNNIDVWDTIYFQASPSGPGTVVPPGEQTKPEATGSAAVKSFTDGKDDLLSNWLNQLSAIADSFDLWAVFREDMNTTSQEYIQLLQNFSAFPDSDRNKPVSDALKIALGITPDMGSTYADVVAPLDVAFIAAEGQVPGYIASNDSLKCEELISYMYDINGKVKELSMEIERNIDAEKAAAREAVVHQSKHIWDLIGSCVQEDIIQKFEDSLDDWWGAKKYIAAGGCTLIQVPGLIVTGGGDILAAIAGFISCYLNVMIGTSYAIALEIAGCIIENCIEKC